MPYRQQVSPHTDYTVPEFMQRTNLAERTIRRRVADGTIPSYHVGSAVRIPAEYVEQVTRTEPSADQIEAEIKRIVSRAPELTAQQRDKLAALLGVEEPAPPRRTRTRSNGGAA